MAPTHPNAIGLSLPGVGSDQPCRARDARINSFYGGLQDGEQGDTDGCVVADCRVGLVPSEAAYPTRHNNLHMWHPQYAVAYVDPASGVANVPVPAAGHNTGVWIHALNLEDGPYQGNGFAPIADIHDPTNKLMGRIDQIWIGQAGVGASNRALVLDGATGVTVPTPGL